MNRPAFRLVVMTANAKKKHPSNERPQGQWNTYDIVCNEGSIKLYVNGLL